MDRETQSRTGWIIVALIIIWTGLSDLMTGKVYGKIVSGATRPIAGWFVHFLGLVLVIAGVYLLIRLVRRR